MQAEQNPAGRLFSILQKANGIGNSADLTILRVWARTFDLKDSDVEAIHEKYLMVVNLTNLTRRIVESYSGEIDLELYLNPFNQIKTGFASSGFHQQWASFGKFLNLETMTGLKFCSDMLSRKMSEIVISESVLTELTEEINGLIGFIESSNISRDLRTLLIEKLEELLDAIENYEISGAYGMKLALDSATGGFIFAVDEIRSEGKRNKVVLEVLAFLEKYRGTVANSVVKELASGAVGFLLGTLN